MPALRGARMKVVRSSPPIGAVLPAVRLMQCVDCGHVTLGRGQGTYIATRDSADALSARVFTRLGFFAWSFTKISCVPSALFFAGKRTPTDSHWEDLTRGFLVG